MVSCAGKAKKPCFQAKEDCDWVKSRCVKRTKIVPESDDSDSSDSGSDSGSESETPEQCMQKLKVTGKQNVVKRISTPSPSPTPSPPKTKTKAKAKAKPKTLKAPNKQEPEEHPALIVEKPQKSQTLTYKVAAKSGALSVYGLRKLPITLYKKEWQAIMDDRKALMDFIAANNDALV